MFGEGPPVQQNPEAKSRPTPRVLEIGPLDGTHGPAQRTIHLAHGTIPHGCLSASVGVRNPAIGKC